MAQDSNMKSREEKEMIYFTWTALFAVIGFSCLLFAFFLKVADGTFTLFFVITGIVMTILGGLSFFFKWQAERQVKKRKARDLSQRGVSV